MRRSTLYVLCALSWTRGALAEEAPLQLWDERYLTLRAGATAQMWVHASVREGYAVVARPDKRGRLLPLTLRLESSSQLRVGSIDYSAPAPEVAKLDNGASEAQVYRGMISIALSIGAPATVEPGAHELKATLAYQACDAQGCLPPATIPIELVVTIRKPPEK